MYYSTLMILHCVCVCTHCDMVEKVKGVCSCAGAGVDPVWIPLQCPHLPHTPAVVSHTHYLTLPILQVHCTLQTIPASTHTYIEGKSSRVLCYSISSIWDGFWGVNWFNYNTISNRK